MKFTDASAKALKLPSGKTDHIEWDDLRPGLGVRVRRLAGGRIQRSWVVQLRADGISQRHDRGPVTATPARRARELANEMFAKVRQGINPKTEKDEKRDENKQTFGLLVRDHLALKEQSTRPRTYAEIARHLQHYFHRLDGLPARNVTQKHVDDELERIATEHGKVAADRARASLNNLCVWALRKGRIDKNPVIGTDKRANEIPRDRVLNDGELKAVWAATGGDDDYSKIVRLLMLTGQRRDEIGGMVESELDRDLRLLSLPRQRTKNNRPHTVPLSDAAMALLPAPRPDRGFLFGRGTGSFSGWARSKAQLDKRIKENDGKGIAPWRLHDLRRSCASGLARLGINLPVVEKILNHVSGSFGGIVSVYQRHDFGAEKRDALDRWARYVEELVGGKPAEVVKFPKRRRG